MGPLVDAGWLAQHEQDADLRVIDFRWYLDGRRGRDVYAAGHIPGAVFVDMEDVTGETGPGRHPLPSAKQFAAAMRAAGVSSSSQVVVYDDAGGSIAARLWWLLRHFGHAQVAVLDGGIQSWLEPLAMDAALPAPGDFVAVEAASEVVDLAAVRDRDADAVLLDARVGARFRGETEPVDARAGHIPGAHNAPWTGNLGPDGRMLSPAQLRERFRDLGVEDSEKVISSCGSGVTACHNILAMEVAGLGRARLHEGSWSEWSRHPELPAAIGD
jgi:thiosulfate/3-mercaptopyruvate sulfurtransferase